MRRHNTTPFLAATCLALATWTAQAAPATGFDPSMAATEAAIAKQPALKALRDAKGPASPAAHAAALKQFSTALGGDFEDMASAGMRQLTLLPGYDEAAYNAFAALPAPRTQTSSMTTCPAGQSKPIFLKTAVKGVNMTFDFRGLEVISAAQRRQLEGQPSLSMSISGAEGQPTVTVYGVFAPVNEKRKALPELRYEPTAFKAGSTLKGEFADCERPQTRSPAAPDTALLPRVDVPDARPGSERPFQYTDERGRTWWLAQDPNSGSWALAHRFEANEQAVALRWFDEEIAAHRKAGAAVLTVSRMRMDAPGVATSQYLNQAVYQYADDVTETVMVVANTRGIQLVRRFVR